MREHLGARPGGSTQVGYDPKFTPGSQLTWEIVGRYRARKGKTWHAIHVNTVNGRVDQSFNGETTLKEHLAIIRGRGYVLKLKK